MPLLRHREVDFRGFWIKICHPWHFPSPLKLIPFAAPTWRGQGQQIPRTGTANPILDSSQMNPWSWPEGKVVQAVSKVFLNRFSPSNDNTGSIMIKMTFLGL